MHFQYFLKQGYEEVVRCIIMTDVYVWCICVWPIISQHFWFMWEYLPKIWNVSLLIVKCIANTTVFAVVYLHFYGVNM